MSENGNIPSLKEIDLLKYLPDIYHESEVIRNLLRICESIWAPLEQQLNFLHTYFDPRLTPDSLLPWLGTWVDVVFDPNISVVFNPDIPEERQRELRRQRELIHKAVHLYQRRGTKLALQEHLRISLGVAREAISIDDNLKDEKGKIMGHQFRVKISLPNAVTSDEKTKTWLRERANRIIQAEKPAHTTCKSVEIS